MNRMFVRFGLPWLIFGSAIYALYWTIWHGESAVSYTPSEEVVEHSSGAQPARRSNTVLTADTDAAFQTSSQAISPRAVPSVHALTASYQGQTRTPVARSADPLEESTAQQQPQTIESNLHLALQDHDPNIRYRALEASDAQGINLPAHKLQQMATSDRDSAVRILAMTKFAQDPEVDLAIVKAVADAGLRDSDPAVIAHARAMLEQLDRASRSHDEAPQFLPGDPAVE